MLSTFSRLTLQLQRLPVNYVLILGAFISIVIVAQSELIPLVFIQDGATWTPYNSSNYRFGDIYFYAPWVREIVSGDFPPTSPIDYSGNSVYSIDSLRFLPALLAAIPGVIFDDFRWVLTLDIVIAPTLQFLCMFWLVWIVSKRPWCAFFCGFLVVFYGAVWTRLPSSPGIYAPWTPWGYISTALSYSQYAIKDLVEIKDYEFISDGFRFLNMSFANVVLVGYFALMALLHKSPTWKNAGALFICSCLIAYSYPTHPVIGYSALVISAAYHLVARRWRVCVLICSVGILTITYLLLTGYLQLMQGAYANSKVINNYFLDDNIALRGNGGLQVIVHGLINKYTMSFSLTLYLTERRSSMRSMVIIVGVLSCILSLLLMLENSGIASRFLNRGIDPVWFLLFAAVVSQAFTRRFDVLLAGQAFSVRNLRCFVCAAGLVLLCMAPMYGFFSYGLRSLNNASHSMSSAQWQAYEWIDQNLDEQDVVAATNWEDVMHLPVYSDVSLLFGSVDLTGREFREEVERYLAVWKSLGLTQSDLAEHLNGAVPSEYKRRLADPRSPPFISDAEYADAQIVSGLIYYPYIRKFEGIEIATDNLKTNPEFVGLVLDIFSTLKPEKALAGWGMSYLITQPSVTDVSLKKDCLEMVFENSARHVYKVLPCFFAK